jgi:hypothetical protein
VFSFGRISQNPKSQKQTSNGEAIDSRQIPNSKYPFQNKAKTVFLMSFFFEWEVSLSFGA